MPTMEDLRQGETPFDGFLYAALGQDRAGNTVSVLSALARLGLDPWDEAADLSDLPIEGARTRLGGLLARFHDVPALGLAPGATIPRLVSLLPKASGRVAAKVQGARASASSMGYGPIILIVIFILLLLQVFLPGVD